ncbi:histidine phosphatase superfamily [Dactylonectria macrodidyma]|uniref:Histidine phosphatase superfamily n=1 Tax=Dactylonectria macrodidyma TaxID=307937 RepID=A0A9P9EJE3_9HYPO|nr:histidine phosphatase superfamily [Dactylonectria macrodidyma]
MAHHWTFSTEPGVFVDLLELEPLYPGHKVTTQPHLGLIRGRKYPSDDPSASDQRDWARFTAYVSWLNEKAPENVAYKVLYLTRHGFGYHNKKHAEVGTAEWDSKVSFLNGDDKETWFDAHLTDVGIQQARDLNTFWTDLVTTDGAPLPQHLYTSPLARCLQTTQYVFDPLMAQHARPFQPTVKELLRERITLHTCDLRRPASWIRHNYPAYTLEDGFAEDDAFGRDGHAETDEEHVVRKQAALEDIWNRGGKAEEVVSLTVHSYAIRAIQAACGGTSCRTREGTSIAILVKGERQVVEE